MKMHHAHSPAMGSGQDADARPGKDDAELSHLKAMLLKVWGPADSWDNPLVGTRYDPALAQQRQHDQLEYRRARWERRKEHWSHWAHRNSG